MDDAIAIISNCHRLLSRLQTLTEADARAAVAACKAWLNKNNPQSEHTLTLVSRPTGSRSPPEILNAILRKIPYAQRKTLLSCRLVNKEWQRNSWAHFWKEFKFYSGQPLAPIAGRYLLPWALEATKGIQVRKLSLWSSPESVEKDLALLLAAPLFNGIRVLLLGPHFSTFHVLLALRSLPHLTYLQLYCITDEPVAWGRNLRMSEREEEETWKLGLGKLKALDIHIHEYEGEMEWIMLDKLAMGLGANLESLSMIYPRHEETGQRGTQLARVLQNVSQNCPHLVNFEVILNPLSGPHWSTDSLNRFFTTQHQLVHLRLFVNVSDQLIQTIAASCVNLKFFTFRPLQNGVANRSLQYLATGPFLRGLHITTSVFDDIPITVAEEGVLEFLRHRGRDLEYFKFPKDPNSRLAPLNEFLPNVHAFGIEHAGAYSIEDVIAFINHADKLENLDIGIPDELPQEIRDVAIARGVRLTHVHMRLYASSREAGWMGV
ncbi:hypothetical protein HK104_001368 [Borealophlyctis nickersoniae]|nr:hypothetical protein HK104_001368 [Borealophlyctis nickersoniae]